MAFQSLFTSHVQNSGGKYFSTGGKLRARPASECQQKRQEAETQRGIEQDREQENRRQIALACSQSGWSEGAALTLGGQRPRRQKTYDFDDL